MIARPGRSVGVWGVAVLGLAGAKGTAAGIAGTEVCGRMISKPVP